MADRLYERLNDIELSCNNICIDEEELAYISQEVYKENMI